MDFMDPDLAKDPGFRGAARKAFWETLIETRVAHEMATGRELEAPAQEDVEHLFRQWLSSIGIPAFPFYPTPPQRLP